MRKRRGLMLAVLLLFALLFAAPGADAAESTCPPAVTAAAALARGEAELTVYSDTHKTEKLGRLKKGETCLVTGVSGEYYWVRFAGTDGYAPKSKLNLTGIGTDAPQAGAAAVSLALERYLYPSPSQARAMAIRGTVRADAPLDTLFVLLWDERLQRMEQVLAKEVKTPSAQLDLREVWGTIAFPAVTAGRKTLVVQGASAGRPVELWRTPVYVCGSFRPFRNINDRCRFSGGRNQEKEAGRSWTPSADQNELTITLPADGSAALMTIEWRHPAAAFTVAFFDDRQQPIGGETRTTGFYADTVAFPAGTRQARLSVAEEDNWVRNLCVYDANHPDNAVQQWQPVPEKLDLMIFSPHQDDELLFMGGAIPYACHLGADVGVVYMTNCGRSRYTEALDGLWTAGLRTHPIFLNWRDQWGNYVKNALKTWSENGVDPQREVVRLIRKYRPEVVLGPDPEGEYGHAQHIVTAQLVAGAVPLAMDESYDPDSAREYGVWEIKKVYLHLYGENRIKMDWERPFSPDSPVSPIFLAKEAFDKHRSQQGFSMERQAVEFANDIFGLYYTAVGPDEAKDDLFEHISLQ